MMSPHLVSGVVGAGYYGRGMNAPTLITVRFFAGARAAAGHAELAVAAGTLAELRARLVKDLGPDFARVLQVSSLLVDGETSHDDLIELRPGSTVDILPPFAGG